MDCKICNPTAEDWNICETCGHDLYPLRYSMREITGDSDWTAAYDALLLPVDVDHVKIINSFFCGMQVPFAVSENRLITRTEKPIYRPLTMDEI